ncbi:hypothetical protein NA57DRAFT_53983 [Rhizodiscina lignyota]|uniref:Uncharacterized protein n=1 Tax=Rhizodiscina lignyota TaxID=1504668 RepID=A0A9P4IMD1_9PEZI|nr:hypothetical protein NA57DRAFT_53983 [Rhizodiscina lignyota]
MSVSARWQRKSTGSHEDQDLRLYKPGPNRRSILHWMEWSKLACAKYLDTFRAPRGPFVPLRHVGFAPKLHEGASRHNRQRNGKRDEYDYDYGRSRAGAGPDGHEDGHEHAPVTVAKAGTRRLQVHSDQPALQLASGLRVAAAHRHPAERSYDGKSSVTRWLRRASSVSGFLHPASPNGMASWASERWGVLLLLQGVPGLSLLEDFLQKS